MGVAAQPLGAVYGGLSLAHVSLLRLADRLLGETTTQMLTTRALVAAWARNCEHGDEVGRAEQSRVVVRRSRR